MHRKIIIFLILNLVSFCVLAQELTLKLPFHANQEGEIIEINGTERNTLIKFKLDNTGEVKLLHGKKRAGFVELRITDKPNLLFSFILSPNENFTLKSDQEYVYKEVVEFQNSTENTLLFEWMDSIDKNQEKLERINHLLLAYTDEHPLYHALIKEREAVQHKLDSVKNTIKSNHTLYAAEFFKFKYDYDDFINTGIKQLSIKDKYASNEKIRQYFKQDIPFEALYGSSLWYTILNAILEIYGPTNQYYNQFGLDMIDNLKKTKDITVYNAMADMALTITDQLGWHFDKGVLVDFLLQDNKVLSINQKLKSLADLDKTAMGRFAPHLIIKKQAKDANPYSNTSTIIQFNQPLEKYTLLIFHQPHCESCEKILHTLNHDYKDTLNKRFRIYSLSANTDTQLCQDSTQNLFWNDQYCEPEGFHGVNFKNYGISDTPTLFIIDSQGRIVHQAQNLEDFLNWFKRNIH